MADTDADAAIDAALNQPKMVKIDGNEVESRSIDELIKADDHLCRKAAQQKRGLGIVRMRIRAPGAQ